ncbi:MAG: hypothetical protein JSS32_09380 [Verrucomicrobia bacterium]|nr:hypothetical protein [Verrucomicrobiota bacterium]
MSAAYLPVSLSLAMEGDSFRVNVASRPATDLDNIHPFAKEAIVCKTRATVLALLEKLQKDNGAMSTMAFWHTHNKEYDGHWDVKGGAHMCAIDNMIAFVKLRDAAPARIEKPCTVM